MKFFSQLNGWQRLFLVLSGLYLIFVSFFIGIVFPAKSECQSNRVFDTVNLIKKYRPNEFGELRTYEVRDRVLKSGADRWFGEVHRQFKGRIDFSSIEEKYKNNIQEIPRQQRTLIVYGIALWIIPVVIVYVVGFLIAWIVKGFKDTNA
jgi:hypothetical protein